MNDDQIQRTVDGVPVKVGDTVWCALSHIAIVNLCRLQRHHLGMWWDRMSHEIYSTERAAIIGAVGRQKIALKKARQETLRATKAIVKLTDRLAAHEEGTKR